MTVSSAGLCHVRRAAAVGRGQLPRRRRPAAPRVTAAPLSNRTGTDAEKASWIIRDRLRDQDVKVPLGWAESEHISRRAAEPHMAGGGRAEPPGVTATRTLRHRGRPTSRPAPPAGEGGREGGRAAVSRPSADDTISPGARHALQLGPLN